MKKGTEGGKEGTQAAHQHHAEQWIRGSPLANACDCIAIRSIRGRLTDRSRGPAVQVTTHRFFFSLSSSSPAAPAPAPVLLAAALPLFLLLLSVLFLRTGGAANVVAVAVAAVVGVPDIASLRRSVGPRWARQLSLPLSFLLSDSPTCTVCTRMAPVCCAATLFWPSVGSEMRCGSRRFGDPEEVLLTD